MDFLKKLFKSSKDQEFTIPSLVPPVPPETHTHQFEIIMKTYAPPSPKADMINISSGLSEAVVFGITTLLFKCLICSELKQEEVLGTDEQPLDAVLNKADLYGPQYIQKDNITYVVAKYQPPIQSPNIPLR